MTYGVVRAGEGPSFPYAGTPLHVLAGADGTGSWMAAEIAIPPHFPGPIPHSHDQFDEAIYVIEGSLRVIEGPEEIDAPAGSFFNILRGTRHGFRNPSDEPVRVLGLWSPPSDGLAIMKAIGAALPTSGPPDPARLREIYEEHHSHLLP